MALISIQEFKDIARSPYADDAIEHALDTVDSFLLEWEGEHYQEADTTLYWDLRHQTGFGYGFVYNRDYLARRLDCGRQIRVLNSISMNGSTLTNVELQNNRFLVQKQHLPFYGDVEASVRYADDTSIRRQQTILGTQAYLRALDDPDAMSKIRQAMLKEAPGSFEGIYPTRVSRTEHVTPIFFGVISSGQVGDIVLSGDGETFTGSFVLPSYSGAQFPYYAQDANAPDITGIYYGAGREFNELPYYTKSGTTINVGGRNYSVWVSNFPILVSEQPFEVTR